MALAFVGTCPDPTPENGFIQSTNITTIHIVGTTTPVGLACNDGYTLNGYFPLYLPRSDIKDGELPTICFDGKWDPPPAICVANNQGEDYIIKKQNFP